MAEPARESSPVARAAAEIRRHGDTLEALAQPLHGTGVPLVRAPLLPAHLLRGQLALAGFVGLTGASLGGSNPSDAGLVTDALSYTPLAAVSAAVITGTTMVASRVSQRRRLRSAEQRQAQLRTLLGEPVDLIRLKPASTTATSGRRLGLRWYGPDNADESLPLPVLAQRLGRLLDGTDGIDIDVFLVSASALSAHLELESGKFGRLVPATNYASVDDVTVVDAGSGSTVLASSRQQCQAVVAELRRREKSQARTDVLQALVLAVEQRSLSSQISEVSARVDRDTVAGLSELAAVVEREIARAEEDAMEIHVQRSGDGLVGRGAVSTAQVVGGELRTMLSFRDPGGRPRMAEAAPRSLLTTTGFSTLPELVTAVVAAIPVDAAEPKLPVSEIEPVSVPLHEDTPDPVQTFDTGPGITVDHARVALLLMLRHSIAELRRKRPAEPQRHSVYGVTAAVAPTRDETATLFQRVAQQPPRLRLGRTGHGAVGNGAMPGVKYQRRQRSRRDRAAQVVAIATMATAFGFCSYAPGYQLGYLETRLNQSVVADYDQAVADRDIYSGHDLDAYRAEVAGPVGAVFRDSIEALRDARTTLDGLSLGAVRAVGVSEDTITAVGDWLNIPPPSDDPLNKEQYPGSGTGTAIGDVSTTNDEVIFRVTGVNGNSTAGYWYTGMNNLASVSGDSVTYPYRDAGVTFTSFDRGAEQVSVPSSPAADAMPSYEVSAAVDPSGSAAEGMELPVQSGTRLVAISIAAADTAANDTALNDTAIVPDVTYFPDTGLYELSVSPSLLQGLERPTLRYWLAPDPTHTVRAGGPMYASGTGGVNGELAELSRAMTPERRAAILTELGLDPDATGGQIVAAIKARDYSFTPLSDANARPTTALRPGDDIGDVLTGVGVGYAGLPHHNCNAAMVTALTATGGEYRDEALNVAVGFTDNGDGELRSLERHTLLVGENGTEIDATPAGIAEATQAHGPAARGLEALGTGALGLVALLGSAALWRRRGGMRRFADTVARQREERSYDDLFAAHRSAVAAVGCPSITQENPTWPHRPGCCRQACLAAARPWCYLPAAAAAAT